MRHTQPSLGDMVLRWRKGEDKEIANHFGAQESYVYNVLARFRDEMRAKGNLWHTSGGLRI